MAQPPSSAPAQPSLWCLEAVVASLTRVCAMSNVSHRLQCCLRRNPSSSFIRASYTSFQPAQSESLKTRAEKSNITFCAGTFLKLTASKHTFFQKLFWMISKRQSWHFESKDFAPDFTVDGNTSNALKTGAVDLTVPSFGCPGLLLTLRSTEPCLDDVIS